MSGPPAQPTILETPPCLRRLAPAAVELIEEGRKRTPAFGRRGVHLVSGRRYLLRVRVAAPDVAGAATDVSADGGECLVSVAPPAWASAGGGAKEYTGIFRARCPSKWPLPVRACLSITLLHSGWGHQTVKVPIVVWPSALTAVAWAVGLISILIGRRILAAWEEKGQRFVDVIMDVCGDLSFWVQIGALTVAAVALVTVLGRLKLAFSPLGEV